MKKLFLLAAVFVALGITPAVFAQGEVDCASLTPCTLVGDPCPQGTCPALLLTVTQAGPAEITFCAAEGFDCPGCKTQRARVNLEEGRTGFFLRFDPEPPPEGTQYSIPWGIANCTGDSGVCGNYTQGSADPDCMDVAAKSNAEVSFIELLPQ